MTFAVTWNSQLTSLSSLPYICIAVRPEIYPYGFVECIKIQYYVNRLILPLETTRAAAITSYREVTLNYGAFDPWRSK